MTAQDEYRQQMAWYTRVICVSMDGDGNLAPLTDIEQKLVGEFEKNLLDKLSVKHGVSADEIKG
jgi:hypothetical protein